MNRTLCTHCGKDMAMEENKVYLEVRTSLKKSKSYYNTNFVPTLCFLSVQTQCIHIPKSSFSYTSCTNNSSSVSEPKSTTDISPQCVHIYIRIWTSDIGQIILGLNHRESNENMPYSKLW
jgi:hypothetical protein